MCSHSTCHQAGVLQIPFNANRFDAPEGASIQSLIILLGHTTHLQMHSIRTLIMNTQNRIWWLLHRSLCRSPACTISRRIVGTRLSRLVFCHERT